MEQSKSVVMEIFTDALKAVDPQRAVREHLSLQDDTLIVRVSQNEKKEIDLRSCQSIFVVGCGKATAVMARAVEDILGDRISKGVISVKYGHLPPRPLQRIDLVEGGHPVPDSQGEAAAKQAIDLISTAGEQDLVIALISGGGSALWPLPVEAISLEEKMAATNALLACGATIKEINTLRKQLSKIKGGGAAKAAFPAQSIVLMISDVEGDDPSVIASGPFTKNSAAPGDVGTILKKYNLSSSFPSSVLTYLEQVSEDSSEEEDVFSNITATICSNLDFAREAAVASAKLKGLTVKDLGNVSFDDAQVSAKKFVGEVYKTYKADPEKRHCVIAGGETTVVLGDDFGKGGRNQEFALAAAFEIETVFAQDSCKVTLLSCGTDGTDGPTDAAGAIVDRQTLAQAKSLDLDSGKALKEHNAYPYFERLEGLVKTGPTNTNVMDLQIAIIEPLI